MQSTPCASWLGILLLQLTAHAQSGGELVKKRLDAFGAPEMPGVAYAIVEQGAVSEIGAVGVKRLGSHDPIGPATPFLTGSISKSFTAIGVMQLVEAGRLSLDAPVAGYLPAFAGGSSSAITIRQLLSHTSGYSTYQGRGPALHQHQRVQPLESNLPGITPGIA